MKFKRKSKGSKAPTRRRRRRANPMMPVILANPRRRKYRARRKRRSNGKPKQLSLRMPRRHHKWGTVKGHTRRVNPQKRYRRRRRHSNPMFGKRMSMGPRSFTWGVLIGIGVAGVLGIVTARVISGFYMRNVSSYVLGSEGAADPTSWRAVLDDVLRIVVMELGVMVGSRAIQSMKVRQEFAMAYFYAGTAETARHAGGVLLKRLSPTTDRAKYGLDGVQRGAGGKVPGFVTDAGHVYQLNAMTGDYDLAGIVDVDQFSGVMRAKNF